MRKTLRRRAASVLTALCLGLIGVLAVPAPAMAEQTCIDVPIENENDEPIAWVCYELGEDPVGNLTLYVRVTVNGRATTYAYVDPFNGRLGDWVKVCLSTGPVTYDICVLPE
jgi:hypothetical protein